MFFGGDPFEHFAHHGGGGGRRARSAANVDTTKLYETLGVSSRTEVVCSMIYVAFGTRCYTRLLEISQK